MAKQVKARVRMKIPGGGATPAPPVGAILGQHQVNLMDFCKQFNAETADRRGTTVPVLVTIYKDKSFDFVVKTPPTSELIRKKLNIKKGSSTPHTQKVGTMTRKDVEEIAKTKLPDLNVEDLTQAGKVVAGTARSMGVEVTDGE